MRTPSNYSVLKHRYIDQWKVTELKEELKRRKLSTKGLKEDLVKRLDEAIRDEDEEQSRNGVEHPPPESVDEAAKVEQDGVQMDEGETVVPALFEETVGNDDGTSCDVGVVSIQEDGKECLERASQDKMLEEKESGLINDQPSKVEVSSVTEVTSAGLEEKFCEDTLSKTVTGGQEDMLEEKESELINDQPSFVEVSSVTEVPSASLDEEVCEDTLSKKVTGALGLQDDKMEWENEDSKAQQVSQDIKPSHEDVKLDTSDSNNQVSEVSTNLGFSIKSNNSISSDSVSFNEKNELEDNTITDNVKLETDVKPEMVQPSSSDLVPDGGESHPKDVEEPHENKVSFEETDNNVTNADVSQKNHIADLGSSEKLNLDRSSEDDSMEYALESKQINSKYISVEDREIMEKTEVTIMKDEDPSAAVATYSPGEEKSIPENKNGEAAPSDKRKLPEEEVSLNNEPSKRLRKWKSENNRARELQISDISSPTATDLPDPITLKRTFSRSYSVGTNDSDATKEREVPPSTKAATNSLRIDRFLRPFTLKAVQELLAKTGTVSSFWMDHIKTHCYVTYSSVEECVATRNAVYNLQWPPNGGRHLVAEFVDPEEVKLRVDPPPQLPAALVNTVPAKASEPLSTLPQASPRQKYLKQQVSEKLTLPPPPPPPLSNPALAREWGQPQLPPPPPKEKAEAPIVTLDDLFRKTKATPRIYYLPVSEERVSATLEERRKSSRQ